MIETVSCSLVRLGYVWCSEGLSQGTVVFLSTCCMLRFVPATGDLEWGRDSSPPSWRMVLFLFTYFVRSYGRDPLSIFTSLETSPLALGSYLFSVWNVLFWFWVKPQEKGFYFWNAHFQLYIPLDGIWFSEIGVCANGIMSHISSLGVEMLFCLREGDGMICQQPWSGFVFRVHWTWGGECFQGNQVPGS